MISLAVISFFSYFYLPPMQIFGLHEVICLYSSFLTFSISTYKLLIFLVQLVNLALYSQTKVYMKFILLLILIKVKVNHNSKTVVDMKFHPLPVVANDTKVEKILTMLKLCEYDTSTY